MFIPKPILFMLVWSIFFWQTLRCSLWPGVADVPALLRYRHLQRPTVCRLQKGVRPEPGKDHRANQYNNPGRLVLVLRISITTAPTMLTARPSIDQRQPTCCLCSGGRCGRGGHWAEPCMDILSGRVGGGRGVVRDVGCDGLSLIGNVKGCTNLCHTLISNGGEHNETTTQRREEW